MPFLPCPSEAFGSEDRPTPHHRLIVGKGCDKVLHFSVLPHWERDGKRLAKVRWPEILDAGRLCEKSCVASREHSEKSWENWQESVEKIERAVSLFAVKA